MNAIHLSFLWPLLVLSGTVLIGVLVLRQFKSKSSDFSYSEEETEKDWTLPAVDAYAHLNSPFHRWDPRIKMVSLLIYFFLVASVSQLSWAFLALVIAAVAVWMTHIPLRYPLRRVSAITLFLGMFLVVMPLTVPVQSGDVLVVFDPFSFLSFNLRGFKLAALVCCKAVAIALMMEILVGTAPLTVTVQALLGLRVPQQICLMILLAHRYVFVFYHEMKRMAISMEVRGFRKRTHPDTLRTFGNFLGMLLVRSFERTQRVYDAMLARGYQGMLTRQMKFESTPWDWFKGFFWISMGIFLLCSDRLWKLSFPF